MKDHEIKELFGIPNSTLYDWRKREDYKKNILNFLEKIDKKEVFKLVEIASNKVNKTQQLNQ
jgi:hypothetical protein